MDASQLETLKVLQEMDLVDMSKIYTIVGVLVVTQLGSMITIIIATFKMYGKIVAWKTSMEHIVGGNTKDVNEAHGKIRSIEQRFMDGH